LLATVFPNSAHVRQCELLGFPDEDMWEFASANGFTIVSKDSDIQQRGLLYGHPPKIICLRVGNCTRQQIFQLLTTHERYIQIFFDDPFGALLVLS
jgi:predicted nuclease of predicted toxin-antitoxin system